MLSHHQIAVLYNALNASFSTKSDLLVPSGLCPNGGRLLREQWMGGHGHTGRATGKRTRTPPSCSIHLWSGCH